MKLLYELQHEQPLQGFVEVVFMVHGIDTTVIVVDVSIASTVEILQQYWEQCPSPLPRAVWLLQPGFFESFVRILRYSFNQIHTIHNSFEVFQPFFPRLHHWNCTGNVHEENIAAVLRAICPLRSRPGTVWVLQQGFLKLHLEETKWTRNRFIDNFCWINCLMSTALI